MALKKLASVAEKLIALIPSEESSSEMSDEDEEITSNEGEEVIVNTEDCDNMGMKKDSLKKAVGANERKRRAEDSIVEDAISNAWAKRYGGKR